MTRLMARDICHPRQCWRVSVDRDSPRHYEEKQHADMRNRIRARARVKREMLNVRAWRLDIFLVLLKRRNEEKSFSENERERERQRKRGRGK